MDYNSYGGGGGGGGGGQHYTTSYGAAGNTHNGGGFIGGGGDATSSQAGPGGGRNFNTNVTCRPVTVAQILSGSQLHAEAPFKIDGEHTSHLTLVGQVRSIQPLQTNVTYKIDDGTGVVEVRQWNIMGEGETSNNNNNHEFDDYGDDGGMDIDKKRTKREIKENDYVRVWGIPKEYNGKRSVSSHMVRLISDFDEINYHLLEATSVHLFFTRGPPNQQGQSQGQLGQGQQKQQHQGDAAATGGAAGGGLGLPSSLSLQSRKVYQCLQGANNNEGLNIHVIASNSGLNMTDVYKGIDELVQEGIIFTTLDDETYAILGG